MNYNKNIFAAYKVVPREKYRECNLPEAETRILCEEGLPVLAFLNNVHDNIYLDVNAIQRHHSDYGYQPQLEDKFVVIGMDHGTSICINSHYEIVCVDFCNENPIRFINSKLEYFLEFIAIYHEYSEKITENEMDDDVDQCIHEMEQKLIKVDCRALQDKENWWALILEDQMIML